MIMTTLAVIFQDKFSKQHSKHFLCCMNTSTFAHLQQLSFNMEVFMS